MMLLRASTHIEEGILVLRLNNHVITRDNELFERELVKGDYVLEWFADGKPYTSFGITISSPSTAEFQLFRKLDGSGKDFGGFRFTV